MRALWLAAGMLLLFAQTAVAAGEERLARRAAPSENIAPLGDAGPVPRACTQMWCQEGYTLQFNAVSWPRGHYSLKIIADENVYLCEGSLPLQPCGTPSITCSDPAVQVGESGCAMPADRHGFYAVMLTEIPDNIVVSLTGPGGSFTHESTVEKRCGYPNGEACDPRPCCSAMESVHIGW